MHGQSTGRTQPNHQPRPPSLLLQYAPPPNQPSLYQQHHEQMLLMASSAASRRSTLHHPPTTIGTVAITFPMTRCYSRIHGPLALMRVSIIMSVTLFPSGGWRTRSFPILQPSGMADVHAQVRLSVWIVCPSILRGCYGGMNLHMESGRWCFGISITLSPLLCVISMPNSVFEVPSIMRRSKMHGQLRYWCWCDSCRDRGGLKGLQVHWQGWKDWVLLSRICVVQ